MSFEVVDGGAMVGEEILQGDQRPCDDSQCLVDDHPLPVENATVAKHEVICCV